MSCLTRFPVIAIPLFIVWGLLDANLRAQDARKVREIIAHRGSSLDRPENTLASCRRAIEAGATVTETDIRTTRDGALVCMHDADVSRTTNGKGLVSEKTLAELRQLDAGSWFDPKFHNERIPTLRETLEVCKGKIDVMLDLQEKGEQYGEKVAAEVHKYGDPKRTVLGIRTVEHARLFRKLLPEARQIGLIPTPESLESFAEAGVPMIRLWPRWLPNKELVGRLRQLKRTLHLGAGKGTKEEVVPLLAYEPESLSSEDPAQLIKTLAQLGRAGKSPPAQAKPAPNHADVSYGLHPHQRLDIYLPPTGSGPYPVVLWFGGIWKPAKHPARLDFFGKARCAVIAVQTRTMTDAMEDKVSPPISYVANDACRAVQFVRLNAGRWQLDPQRIAVGGGSQGALPALYVACAGERAEPRSSDPVERVSTRVTCAAAYRSQPTIDPKRMQEWVPGVEWGAPALGCSFQESLKRREELLPIIARWSPDALLHRGVPPLYFENEWGLTQPKDVTETNYKVHSPAWGLGFQ